MTIEDTTDSIYTQLDHHTHSNILNDKSNKNNTTFEHDPFSIVLRQNLFQTSSDYDVDLSISAKAKVFTVTDEIIWGNMLLVVTPSEINEDCSTLIIIDKFGTSVFKDIDTSPDSIYYSSIKNLPSKFKMSSERKVIAICLLHRYAALPHNKVKLLKNSFSSIDYDDTYAGELASKCESASNEISKLVIANLKDFSITNKRLMMSYLFDVVYESIESKMDLNNKLVFHLGDQLEQLFDPLTEYSPEQTEFVYKPPADTPPLNKEDLPYSSPLINSICDELLTLQTNFTLSLVDFLQKFLITLRIEVLNERIPNLTTAKLNRLFPPTIDEVTRINCIFLDNLRLASPYGSFEILKATCYTIPYFYKAYTRHIAATKNFNKELKNFLKTFNKYIPNSNIYNEMKIDSIINGPQEKLLKIKLILDRLFQKNLFPNSLQPEAKNLYENSIEIIDSFAKLDNTPLNSYNTRVFTPSGKILTELAKGWPQELQYKWLKRRVIGVFDTIVPSNNTRQLLVIFSDYVVFLDVLNYEKYYSDEFENNIIVGKKDKPLLSDILMNSLINEVPLPPKIPKLAVSNYSYISNVTVSTFDETTLRFDIINDDNTESKNQKHSYALISNLLNSSGTTARHISDLITKAKILEKETAFHLFKSVTSNFSLYCTAHELNSYLVEKVRSKFAVFLNISPKQEYLVKHNLFMGIFIMFTDKPKCEEINLKVFNATDDKVTKEFNTNVMQLIPTLLSLLQEGLPNYYSSINSNIFSKLIEANQSLLEFIRDGYTTSTSDVPLFLPPTISTSKKHNSTTSFGAPSSIPSNSTLHTSSTSNTKRHSKRSSYSTLTSDYPHKKKSDITSNISEVKENSKSKDINTDSEKIKNGKPKSKSAKTSVKIETSSDSKTQENLKKNQQTSSKQKPTVVAANISTSQRGKKKGIFGAMKGMFSNNNTRKTTTYTKNVNATTAPKPVLKQTKKESVPTRPIVSKPQIQPTKQEELRMSTNINAETELTNLISRPKVNVTPASTSDFKLLSGYKKPFVVPAAESNNVKNNTNTNIQVPEGEDSNRKENGLNSELNEDKQEMISLSSVVGGPETVFGIPQNNEESTVTNVITLATPTVPNLLPSSDVDSAPQSALSPPIDLPHAMQPYSAPSIPSNDVNTSTESFHAMQPYSTPSVPGLGFKSPPRLQVSPDISGRSNSQPDSGRQSPTGAKNMFDDDLFGDLVPVEPELNTPEIEQSPPKIPHAYFSIPEQSKDEQSTSSIIDKKPSVESTETAPTSKVGEAWKQTILSNIEMDEPSKTSDEKLSIEKDSRIINPSPIFSEKPKLFTDHQNSARSDTGRTDTTSAISIPTQNTTPLNDPVDLIPKVEKSRETGAATIFSRVAQYSPPKSPSKQNSNVMKNENNSETTIDPETIESEKPNIEIATEKVIDGFVVKKDEKKETESPIFPNLPKPVIKKIGVNRSDSFREIFEFTRLVLDENDASFNWKRYPSDRTLSLKTAIGKSTRVQSVANKISTVENVKKESSNEKQTETSANDNNVENTFNDEISVDSIGSVVHLDPKSNAILDNKSLEPFSGSENLKYNINKQDTDLTDITHIKNSFLLEIENIADNMLQESPTRTSSLHMTSPFKVINRSPSKFVNNDTSNISINSSQPSITSPLKLQPLYTDGEYRSLSPPKNSGENFGFFTAASSPNKINDILTKYPQLPALKAKNLNRESEKIVQTAPIILPQVGEMLSATEKGSPFKDEPEHIDNFSELDSPAVYHKDKEVEDLVSPVSVQSPFEGQNEIQHSSLMEKVYTKTEEDSISNINQTYIPRTRPTSANSSRKTSDYNTINVQVPKIKDVETERTPSAASYDIPLGSTTSPIGNSDISSRILSTALNGSQILKSNFTPISHENTSKHSLSRRSSSVMLNGSPIDKNLSRKSSILLGKNIVSDFDQDDVEIDDNLIIKSVEKNGIEPRKTSLVEKPFIRTISSPSIMRVRSSSIGSPDTSSVSSKEFNDFESVQMSGVVSQLQEDGPQFSRKTTNVSTSEVLDTETEAEHTDVDTGISAAKPRSITNSNPIRVISENHEDMLSDLEFSSFDMTFGEFDQGETANESQEPPLQKMLFDKMSAKESIKNDVQDPIFYRIPQINTMGSISLRAPSDNSKRDKKSLGKKKKEDDAIWVSPSKLDMFDYTKLTKSAQKRVNKKLERNKNNGTVESSDDDDEEEEFSEVSEIPGVEFGNETSYGYLGFVVDAEKETKDNKEKRSNKLIFT